MVRYISLVLCGAFVACGGAQVEEEGLPLADVETTAAPPPVDKPSEEGGAAGLNDAQKEQMKVALRRGGEKAQQCNKVSGTNISGEGEVQVVFDGVKGRAVDATVGAPFAGTDIEDCIKRSFVDEIIVPFDGTLTVPYSVKIEAKAAPAKDPKKK